MTFKPQDCPRCKNRGIVRKAHYPNPITFPPVIHEPQITEHPCDCWYGQKQVEFEILRQSPDYVNPLTGLTDEQILGWINKGVERDELIDSEFEVEPERDDSV